MKKRLLSIVICAVMIASLMSTAVYAKDTDSQAPAAVSFAKEIKAKVSLSKTSYTWNGKEKKPGVTVTYKNAVLKKGQDYTVAYKNNVNVGMASAKVTLKGKYKGSFTASFKILPKGTSLTGLSGTADTVKIKWAKRSEKMSKARITGYQIQLATDKQFTKNTKSKKIEGWKTTSKTIKNLKSGTKYYVRVRTYKTIGEKTFYSPWSGIKSVKNQPENIDPPVPEGQALNLSPSDTALLDAVYDVQEDNTIISPLSVNMALSMLLEGANGETKTELENYLGVSADELDSYVQTIQSSAADEKDVKMILSNAFWYKPDQEVNPDYENALVSRYGAMVSPLDFMDAQAAADIINSWCSEKTNGLIPAIVTADAVYGMADVLLNTLYFKDSWLEPVEDYSIKDGVFHGFDQDLDVSFLHSSENIAYENDRALAFKKPYLHNYAFIGILPKEGGEFTMSDLDIKGLLQSPAAGYNEILVSMPKFSIESGGSIAEILQMLGLQTVFTWDADLTGIAKDLAVSDVIHKTKMILDENGTEAAAATAVTVKDASAPIDKKTLKITLDRPYAFLIIDQQNGNVLFMGKVTAPTAE